jgi:serine/threonine protein kinase
MEAIQARGLSIPDAAKINSILAEHGVPLAIKGRELVLTTGDITISKDYDGDKENVDVRGPVIGRGGFSVVFLIIKKTAFGEFDYAMKVLEPSVFMQNKDRAKTRFQRETKALRKLRHRGIVEFLEAGIDSEQKPYILMPYIQGTDLRLALKHANPATVLMAFDEILQALQFAHEQGVFHRDLKPQNILVRESDGQPIILDFGCAYLLDDLDDETLTTTLIGTSAYVPSEVHLNPKNRTAKQDVYACGVLLYEVIAGKLPRPDDYESIETLIKGYTGIDDVIRAALAPERTRVASAKDLREKLATVARGLLSV